MIAFRQSGTACNGCRADVEHFPAADGRGGDRVGIGARGDAHCRANQTSCHCAWIASKGLPATQWAISATRISHVRHGDTQMC